MLPVENLVGAVIVAGAGFLVSTHVPLIPHWASAIRVIGALAAMAILAYPFLR